MSFLKVIKLLPQVSVSLSGAQREKCVGQVGSSSARSGQSSFMSHFISCPIQTPVAHASPSQISGTVGMLVSGVAEM